MLNVVEDNVETESIEINTEDDSATVLVSTETRDMQIIVDLKDIVRDKED